MGNLTWLLSGGFFMAIGAFVRFDKANPDAMIYYGLGITLIPICHIVFNLFGGRRRDLPMLLDGEPMRSLKEFMRRRP